MATNFYMQAGLPGGRNSEQRLIESLIVEAIKYYGFDVYYLPRTQVNLDTILGEDPLSKFENAIPLEMYLENVDGYGGDGELMQKFGIEIRDTATFVVSRMRWEDVIQRGRGADLVLPNRPAEGDLLYFPLTHSYFELKRVEAHDPFYQLGKLHVYKLQAELWQYSSEELNTGIAEIDELEDKLSNNISRFGFALENGYNLLLNTPGTLEDSGTLLWEDYSSAVPDPQAQNKAFNTQALDILDFTEINPFGEIATR